MAIGIYDLIKGSSIILFFITKTNCFYSVEQFLFFNEQLKNYNVITSSDDKHIGILINELKYTIVIGTPSSITPPCFF